MRVTVTPWVRDALTGEEWAQLSAMRREPGGHLALFARGPGGPYTARLFMDGMDEVRVEDVATIGLLLRRVLLSVWALT